MRITVHTQFSPSLLLKQRRCTDLRLTMLSQDKSEYIGWNREGHKASNRNAKLEFAPKHIGAVQNCSKAES